MERLDLTGQVPDRLRGGVIALGNFDGFHRGHQAVVGRAIARARANGRPALVATFDPHPVRFFSPDAAPFRLTSLDQRERLFAAAGADAMIEIPFDAAQASLTAEEIVQHRARPRPGSSPGPSRSRASSSMVIRMAASWAFQRPISISAPIFGHAMASMR